MFPTADRLTPFATSGRGTFASVDAPWRYAFSFLFV